MKIYLVGGAVRDKLLGLPIKERDWVVVGATVDEMIALGYRQVGKDFPVFLHPETHEEYALARVERKISLGYKGFSFDTDPSVSLAEDLLRRDLTINAMAQDEDGNIIDPYHGQEDIKKKMLRHVSPAFSEDPVRILRVARFYARYTTIGFSIAPETLNLMKKMVDNGEINALVSERVFKELERALMEPHPENFFFALQACHALSILFPHLSLNGKGMQALQTIKLLTPKPALRMAALLHDYPQEWMVALEKRYRLPRYYQALIKMSALYSPFALQSNSYSAAQLLDLLCQLDSFRREPRFKDFILVCQAINHSYDFNHLLSAHQAAKSINIKALVTSELTGPELANAIKAARLKKIQALPFIK